MIRVWVFIAVACAVSVLGVGAPEIAVDTLLYDGGTVLEGAVVSHTFVLTNVGDEPLIISTVSATCGCTATAFPTPKELAPGASAELTASVNTRGFYGSVTKAVRIYSNDPSYAGTYMSLQIAFTVRSGELYHKALADIDRLFYVLVDLREPEAYDAGHILGAINLPSSRLDEWKTALPTGVTLIFYDADGTTTRGVIGALRALGYIEAWGLFGGLDEWLRARAYDEPLTSMPLEAPGPRPEGLYLGTDEFMPIEFSRMYRLLVDVRTQELFEENHLLGAVNRPFLERETWLPELPRGVDVIFYDFDGSTADVIAVEALEAGMFQAYSLLGGLADWFTQFNEVYLTSLGLAYPAQR